MTGLVRCRTTDHGQTTLLTIGYAVIALLLVTVVVNLSRVFLAQRALDATADELAIAAVQAVRVEPYYGEGAGDQLALADESARRAAVEHVQAPPFTEPCAGFALDRVETSETAVTVTVSCRVDIPFANVAAGYTDGVPIVGTATARQTVRP